MRPPHPPEDNAMAYGALPCDPEKSACGALQTSHTFAKS